MSDFRVDTFFFRHNKTKRLQRMLGHEGVFALMKLWAYASDCKYDGEHIYTADDIELAVDWNGEPGALVAALASIDPHIGFIDAVDGGYVIHDWEEHNCYAATANTRTDAARNAANARWKKKRGIADDATENDASCGHPAMHHAKSCATQSAHDAAACNPHDANHAPGNAPAPSPSPVPSPSPSPSPVQKSEVEKHISCERSAPMPAPTGAEHAKKTTKNFCAEKFEEFWEAFGDKRGRAPAWNAWRKIKGLDRKMAEAIIAAARRYASQRPVILARNGTPKMAQGWLNDKRWEDEGEVVTASATPMNKDLDAAFSRVLEGSNGCV